MTCRLRIAASAFLLGIGAVSQAATSPGELLARAKTARQAAEKSLAQARTRRLGQRKALAAALHKHYEALAVARAEAKRAQASLERLKADTADAERRAALADHRTRTTIAQAAAAAGATVRPAAPIDAMEEAVWQRFQARLTHIEGELRITVQPQAIVGRRGGERRVPVVRLGSYAAYACGDGRDACGLLALMEDGRQRVVGPYLDAAQCESLRAAARGAVERLPLDVDGALRDRAPAEPKTVQSWLAAGGTFVYPIIVVGALGVLLIAERLAYLALTKTRPTLVSDVLACLARGDTAEARRVLGAGRTPAGRVLAAGIDAVDKPESQREAAMESALLAEAPRLERSLSLLGALAGVAPLLGLLGTVSGMIATFDTISAAGTGNPRLLSGGISEALITTQLGLMVAIPLLLAHAWLRRWAERREAMLEHHAVQVFGIESNGKEQQAEEAQ